MKNIAGKLTGFAAALGFTLVTGSASASPIVGNQWYEFAFVDVGGALTACSGCTPGTPAGISTFAPDPAWTFNCGAAGCTLTVTDAFVSVDVFELFDSGTSLGSTSAPTDGGACGSDVLCALGDSHYSHGVFVLGAGAHSITGVHTAGIPGAAFLIVTGAVPEPASLLLIGAGLLMLFGMRRRA